MAGKQPQQAMPKATVKQLAKEVVKQERQVKQNQPKKKYFPVKNKKYIKREVRKDLKKQGFEGPKPRFSVSVSATIGKVGPNKAQGPELQISTFMHPSLMKEPNDGTNFGPLQSAAAQWGLWRLKNLSVTFTPLVGPSAVTGSVFRISLNMAQSPGATSWGGLGARKHRDVAVGKQFTWKLQRGDLTGPRETWWLTDTNEEGAQSCGPLLEIHGLGATTSTYKDAAWNGDLFIVEVKGRWEFANYNSKPALGMLERITESTSASIEVTDGNMIMTVPRSSQLARHMGERYEKSGNASTVGETIWQIVDEGAGLVANAAPPPFTWLIKGGWWFVKKLLGRSANTDAQYLVYASLADAQNNRPVEAQTFPKTTHTTVLSSTQINAPNTGPNTTTGSISNDISVWPIIPSGSPVVDFYVSGRMKSLHMGGQAGTQATTLVGGLIYRPELPPSATPPVSKWEFTVHEGNNIVGAGMSCVMFRANDVVSWSQDGQDLVGWYRLDNIKTTQLTVSWRQQNRVVYGWGNVVAWNSEEWHTNSETPHQPILRLTYWLVKVNVTADPADFDILQKMPLGYLDPYNTSESTAAIQKINFQTVQKPSGGNTLRVQYSSTPQQGDFVVIWQIGRHDFDMSTGKGTAVDTVSDYIFPQAKDAAGGLWYRALTMVGPRTDRMVLHFYYPTATDDLVEQIITQIQSRYKLAPLPADSDSDTSSSDSEMDCYDGFEKLQVYENVRQAGLNHAVSENLALAAVKKKLRRGHAE
uniref:Capsid n=2 Tax=Astroviridae TaxID=39733 RepID=D0U6L4_9VIRU|nr:capsid [HMO Astrovirus B]